MKLNRVVKQLEQFAKSKKLNSLYSFLDLCQQKYGKSFVNKAFYQFMHQASVDSVVWLINDLSKEKQTELENEAQNALVDILTKGGYVKGTDWTIVDSQLFVKFYTYGYLCRVSGEERINKLFAIAKAEYLGEGIELPQSNQNSALKQILGQDVLENLRYRVNYRYHYCKSVGNLLYFAFYLIFLAEGFATKLNLEEGSELSKEILLQKAHPELSLEKVKSFTSTLASFSSTQEAHAELVNSSNKNKYELLQTILVEVMEDIVLSKDENLPTPTVKPISAEEARKEVSLNESETIDYSFQFSLDLESKEVLETYWVVPQAIINEYINA